MLCRLYINISNMSGVFVRKSLVLAVAAAILASGCDKKAEGQTVAIVNGEEITATELNAELANLNIPANAQGEEARNRVLQGLIDRRLLAQQAKEEGIDQSPEFINRQRRATEDLLIGMLANRQVDTAQLPSQKEISAFEASRPNMFAQREVWNLQQVRFPMPTDQKIQQAIQQTKTLDQLIKVLSDNKISFQRAQTKLDTAVIPPDMFGRLATLSPGEPFIIPVGDQAVASSIVGREAAPITGEQARPIAVSAIRRDQGSKFMQDRLTALREKAKIEYKEGFDPKAAAAPAKAPAKQ